MRDEALDLLRTAMESAYGDEPVTDPAELPDDLDDLCALVDAFIAMGKALAKVRREVEVKTGDVLGPGVTYRYGEYDVRWGHSYSWVAQESMEPFITELVAEHPEYVGLLFNMNGARKTGLEEIARREGLDPETVINTVLWKRWDDNPKVKFKPLEDK